MPPSVDKPTWAAQSEQKLLRGAGLAERMEVCKEFMMKVLKGEDNLLAHLKLYFATTKFCGAICDDIKRERERIGGDWAVALVVNTRWLRDFLRSRLGPDLTFIVLDMAWEDLEERMRSNRSMHGEVLL